MNTINEETLLRYLEADLPRDEMDRVRQAIADSPDARTKYEMLKSSAEMLEQTFGKLGTTSTPKNILDMIENSTAESPTNVVNIAGRNRFSFPMRMAAGILIGFVGGVAAMGLFQDSSEPIQTLVSELDDDQNQKSISSVENILAPREVEVIRLESESQGEPLGTESALRKQPIAGPPRDIFAIASKDDNHRNKPIVPLGVVAKQSQESINNGSSPARIPESGQGLISMIEAAVPQGRSKQGWDRLPEFYSNSIPVQLMDNIFNRLVDGQRTSIDAKKIDSVIIVQLIRTYRSATGAICRVAVFDSKDSDSVEVLACRVPDGMWRDAQVLFTSIP